MSLGSRHVWAGMQQGPCPTYAPTAVTQYCGGGRDKMRVCGTRLALAPQRPCLPPPVLGALLSGLSHSELLLRPSGTRPPTFPLHQTTGQSCAQGRPHKAGTLTRSAFYNAGWDWADLTEDPTPHQGWACCWSGELGLTCQVGCVACAWPLREPPPSTVREAVRDNTGTETPQGRA